jgi:hypothetical protein
MPFFSDFELKIIYIEVRSFALASRNILKISHQPEIIIFVAKGVCHYGTEVVRGNRKLILSISVERLSAMT